MTLDIEAVSELGEPGRFSLILEAMNRHSNLILCDGEGRIIDCLRRVDFEMSQQRQVLPGLYYQLPPRQEKRSPLDMEERDFCRLLQCAPPELQADKWLLDTFAGLSPLISRELSYRFCGEVEADILALSRPELARFLARELAMTGEKQPVLLLPGGCGRSLPNGAIWCGGEIFCR